MKIQRTVETPAAPAAVFAYLSDFTTTTEWDPGTVSTTRVSGDGGVGTEYHNVSTFMGRETELTYRVTEHDARPPLRAARREQDRRRPRHHGDRAARHRLPGDLHRRLRVQRRRQDASPRCSARR